MYRKGTRKTWQNEMLRLSNKCVLVSREESTKPFDDSPDKALNEHNNNQNNVNSNRFPTLSDESFIAAAIEDAPNRSVNQYNAIYVRFQYGTETSCYNRIIDGGSTDNYNSVTVDEDVPNTAERDKDNKTGRSAVSSRIMGDANTGNRDSVNENKGFRVLEPIVYGDDRLAQMTMNCQRKDDVSINCQNNGLPSSPSYRETAGAMSLSGTLNQEGTKLCHCKSNMIKRELRHIVRNSALLISMLLKNAPQESYDSCDDYDCE